MKCAELDTQLKEQDASPSVDELRHIRSCKRCMQRHGLHLMLPLHVPTEDEALGFSPQDDWLEQVSPQESFEQSPIPSLAETLSGSMKSTPAPGELAFLQRLETLGKEQSNAFHRAQLLHQKVQRGDRLFWRGEYSQAAGHYREALMVVTDNQGRVALQNKLARAQMHRQRTKEAIELLSAGLTELGEPAPPQQMIGFHLMWAHVMFWSLLFVTWLQQQWPKLFPPLVQYGDRSRAAQQLYRELASLAQGHNDAISRWAHLRELRWAMLLGHPLEMVVSFGRHAVKCAQDENDFLASAWCRKINDIASSSDTITQASAHFYAGRVAYIQGRWGDARFHLEQCVRFSQSSEDAYLRDAALQHLIRVYRNDGNFSEAVRVASQLLGLYHKLGNLPRLSACCRHFALIYASYGDLRQAAQWATKALQVALRDTSQSEESALSLLRCYVLQGDIELRRGRKDMARRFIGAAIRLQREYQLSPAFLRDGMQLLRQILGAEQAQSRVSIFKRVWRWVESQWAVMRGDLERAHHLQQEPRVRTAEHQVPQEMAYLFQEYAGSERPGGLREAIPASTFAESFLSGEEPIRPGHTQAEQEADQIASMFPVGAVSSRWGRGAMARDCNGAITTQFSNASEAPWGYFFADDIG